MHFSQVCLQDHILSFTISFFDMLGELFTISGHVLDFSRGKPTITYILIITYNKSFGASLIAKTATFCPHAPGNSRRIDPADSARSVVGGGAAAMERQLPHPSVRPPSLLSLADCITSFPVHHQTPPARPASNGCSFCS